MVHGAEDLQQLGMLLTEAVDPRFSDIDKLSVTDAAALMNEADISVPLAVRDELPSISRAIEATVARMRSGGRLFYVGAGTAGRIGVLDASEAPPTFGTDPGLVQALIAGGTDAITVAIENAEDSPEAGKTAIAEAQVCEKDVVIGISSSGRTPFVLGAMEQSRSIAAKTIGISCNQQTPLTTAVDLPIEVLVGGEFVSGSTRLKAGTAQKLILNMISTITMVQLGKTYGNLMIDVRVTNEKLRERAIRIVQILTDATYLEAKSALKTCGFDVKRAVVHLKLGVDACTAETILEEHNGSLRMALSSRPLN